MYIFLPLLFTNGYLFVWMFLIYCSVATFSFILTHRWRQITINYFDFICGANYWFKKCFNETAFTINKNLFNGVRRRTWISCKEEKSISLSLFSTALLLFFVVVTFCSTRHYRYHQRQIIVHNKHSSTALFNNLSHNYDLTRHISFVKLPSALSNCSC